LTIKEKLGDDMKWILEKEITRIGSHQNRVFYATIENDEKTSCAYKVFSSYEAKEREAILLKSLRKHALRVPKLLDVDDKGILREWIDGPTVEEVLIQMEEAQVDHYDAQVNESLIYRLINWFYDFHTIASCMEHQDLVMHDVHPSNFVMRRGQIYGLDFEDCRPGVVETDFGRFLVFIMRGGAFEWRVEFVKQMLKSVEGEFRYNLELVKQGMEDMSEKEEWKQISAIFN
jgi:prepilin signal peptidase PulO-like enzyme (type II secretory pathway)